MLFGPSRVGGVAFAEAYNKLLVSALLDATFSLNASGATAVLGFSDDLFDTPSPHRSCRH